MAQPPAAAATACHLQLEGDLKRDSPGALLHSSPEGQDPSSTSCAPCFAPADDAIICGLTHSWSAYSGAFKHDQRLAAQLTAGTIIAGRFEVVQLLAAGSFGVAYTAIDRTNNRRLVAVKVARGRALPPERIASYTFDDFLRQECNSYVQMGAAEEHANLTGIPRFFSAGERAWRVQGRVLLGAGCAAAVQHESMLAAAAAGHQHNTFSPQHAPVALQLGVQAYSACWTSWQRAHTQHVC